jgi:hypothetical protein
MLRQLARPVWVRLLTWIMGWAYRMAFRGSWPGLPCMVFVNFNSWVARLSGCTVKRDASGTLSVTLTWSAPADMPIAVIGEDSVWPPDTVSFATALMSNWTGYGDSNNAHDVPQDSQGDDGSKLVCAWCTPRRAGVIVTASSSVHNRSD